MLAQAPAKAELVPSQPQLVLNYNVDQKQDRDLIIGSDSVHCTHEKNRLGKTFSCYMDLTNSILHCLIIGLWLGQPRSKITLLGMHMTGASTNPKKLILKKTLIDCVKAKIYSEIIILTNEFCF